MCYAYKCIVGMSTPYRVQQHMVYFCAYIVVGYNNNVNTNNSSCNDNDNNNNDHGDDQSVIITKLPQNSSSIICD